MKPLFLFLFLAAFGNAVYHVGQKCLPSQANPMVQLMAVYAAAFLLSAAAAPFFRGPATLSWTAQAFSWPVLVLAVGVLLIEVGFLLAYRTGGSLQWSGAAVNGVAALMLMPVAVAAFREHFSPAKALGVVLTLVGLFLVARK
jgi:drug/metabolite transporter (DMT)-like permease